MNTATQVKDIGEQFVPLGHAAPAEQAAEQESAAIMADMAGSGGPVDAIAVKRRFKISSQVVMMMSVLALSAAALYFMRKLGTGAGMKFVQPPIDFLLDKDPPDRVAEHEKLLDDLRALGITPQIPSEDVDKNPFQFVDTEVEGPIHADDSDANRRLQEKRERELAEQRQRDIDRALSSIVVHSILTGSRAVANVNDGLVSVGDVIDEVLEVVEIKDRYIVVEAGERRYTIEMKERTENRPRRRPRRN